jgi:hypothetical protein
MDPIALTCVEVAADGRIELSAKVIKAIETARCGGLRGDRAPSVVALLAGGYFA